MSCSTLRNRLEQRLVPSASWLPDQAAERSDFDLNPSLPREKRELRPAAVLVPIVMHDDGPMVLMTRRSDTLARHTGQIAFPGGRLDPGETAEQAALREAYEEVALDPALVEVVGLGDPYETGTGFLVTPVIGWLKTSPHVVASPDEVAEVFEVPWAFLMDPLNHQRHHLDPETGPKRWFWAMPFEDRYIWGVTAGILRGLFQRLYGEEASPLAAAVEDAA